MGRMEQNYPGKGAQKVWCAGNQRTRYKQTVATGRDGHYRCLAATPSI